MWTRQNKTRLGEWEYSIQKPMANNVTMRNGLFVALVDWYIIPADGTTEIEGCAINDRFSGENNEHRYCIYQPKRDWETFTMEVDNGTIKQEDVGKTFRITGGLQHINYSTKAEVGWQFRLEEVLSPTLWTFTYNKATQFAPQGPQGNDGQTPNLQIGTVAKLQPDANPTAQLVQDPDDPTMYTLNLWIPAWATGPKGAKGDTGANGTNWRDWTDWQDWATGGTGQPGEDGISPHREWDWIGWTTYTQLAMVRYPDSNNVYWTWIWNSWTPTTGVEVPGTDPNWKKMNRDWEAWPQGEQGGTIVVPVEGKPGKDWIWVDGRDGTDGKSPTDRWTRSSLTNYDPLDMVRAWTGEYDQRGNEIRWYYITENWAFQSDPKNWNPRQLMCKDWTAGKWNPFSVMLWLNHSIVRDEEFESVAQWWLSGWNMPADYITRDSYTGNPDMIMPTKLWIVITKTWHYRIFWHCIIQANTGATDYLNLWRYSIFLRTNRGGSTATTFIWTSKMWWPKAGAWNQWPWLDLHIDIQMDLYEWDNLQSFLRLQTDDNVTTSDRWYYTIIGADDNSGEVEQGVYLWWLFPTYMGVEYVSAFTWQEDDPQMLVWEL